MHVVWQECGERKVTVSVPVCWCGCLDVPVVRQSVGEGEEELRGITSLDEGSTMLPLVIGHTVWWACVSMVVTDVMDDDRGYSCPVGSIMSLAVWYGGGGLWTGGRQELPPWRAMAAVVVMGYCISGLGRPYVLAFGGG